MVAENLTAIIPLIGDPATIAKLAIIAPVIPLIAVALAVIPVMNFIASRKEAKRRVREVAAVERLSMAMEKQAEALYSISTRYKLVKRKKA